MQRHRNLDVRATNRVTVISIILGVFGTLVLGGVMSIIMTLQRSFFILGLVIGIAGILLLGTAYPAYRYVGHGLKEDTEIAKYIQQEVGMRKICH